jgi:hypothetical protein
MGRKPSRGRMPELQEQLPGAPAVAAGLPPDEMAGLRPGDLQLIVAILDAPTLRDAARLAGVSEATAYRRSKCPTFQRALWAARKLYLREAARMKARRLYGLGRPPAAGQGVA